MIALDCNLNTALKLGMICEVHTTLAPTQAINFCGFVYHISSAPFMPIPNNKATRVLSMFQYVQYNNTPHHSYLLINMVVRFLQSLASATPGNVGASFYTPYI